MKKVVLQFRKDGKAFYEIDADKAKEGTMVKSIEKLYKSTGIQVFSKTVERGGK